MWGIGQWIAALFAGRDGAQACRLHVSEPIEPTNLAGAAAGTEPRATMRRVIASPCSPPTGPGPGPSCSRGFQRLGPLAPHASGAGELGRAWEDYLSHPSHPPRTRYRNLINPRRSRARQRHSQRSRDPPLSPPPSNVRRRSSCAVAPRASRAVGQAALAPFRSVIDRTATAPDRVRGNGADCELRVGHDARTLASLMTSLHAGRSDAVYNH